MENREAIEALRDLLDTTREYPHLDGMTMFGDAIELAIAALEKQEQDRWIPVKERPPEEDEDVLISKKPTKLSGYKWSVGRAIRTADPRSGKIQWRDSGFGIIQDYKVLAWRPLPEPYTEEDNDKP